MRLGRAGEGDSRLRQADVRKQYSRSQYNKAYVVGEWCVWGHRDKKVRSADAQNRWDC